MPSSSSSSKESLRLLWCPKNFPTKTFILQFIKVETLWLESLFFCRKKTSCQANCYLAKKSWWWKALQKVQFFWRVTDVFLKQQPVVTWFGMRHALQQMCSLHGVKCITPIAEGGFRISNATNPGVMSRMWAKGLRGQLLKRGVLL